MQKKVSESFLGTSQSFVPDFTLISLMSGYLDSPALSLPVHFPIPLPSSEHCIPLPCLHRTLAAEHAGPRETQVNETNVLYVEISYFLGNILSQGSATVTVSCGMERPKSQY